MWRVRAVFVVLLALALAAPLHAADHKSLPARINAILSDPDLSRGFWGIEAVSLNTGKLLYAQNADKLFTPASNTKLFTTAATLALIGPDYRFRTTVETSGALDKYGRLTSDLVLVGRGDPNLSGRALPYTLKTERDPDSVKVLESLVDQLVSKGLKYVDGNIVGDDSFFAFERYAEGWGQDDLVWGDGAPVSALTINDNVIFVNILPGEHPGERAFVSMNPFADYYRIENRLITTPTGTGPRRIFFNREPGSNLLTLWGNLPVDDPGANEALAIEDPAQFAAQLFRSLLEKRGVTVYGRDLARHNELANLSTLSVTALAPERGGEATPPQPPPVQHTTVLAGYESPPLIEDLRVINKVSQNLHAELMLHLLGREKGTAGTIEGGMEVLKGFLSQAGVPSEEHVFYDGSGLSRMNLVSPHAVVRLLQYAATQPWGQQFRDTLPVAGQDGSLTDRFKGTSAEGKVQAKTGSLSHVKSLSGYANTVSGDRVVFSIFANNHNVPPKRATDTLDRIVEAIVNDTTRK
jgi:D-alanyl-D-alanine carboxypeptidase/D-alanyl-D-alanine-endopeptidase (penicillin-binding protein 4)